MIPKGKDHMATDCDNESVIDDYEEVIQKTFSELIENYVNNYDKTLSLIDKRNSSEERDMDNPLEWPHSAGDDFFLKKNGIFNLGIDFFHELRLLLWKLMCITRKNEDLRFVNMDKVMASSTSSRSGDIHFLETILHMHYVLLQEQKVMQIENISRKTRYSFYNVVLPYLQNRTARDKSTISEMVNELLGNSEQLISNVPTHIHLLNMDRVGNDAEKKNSGVCHWKDTKDCGNNHSEELQKLNFNYSWEHKCLLAYLIKYNQKKNIESTNYYPLSLVLSVFMDEFSLDWRKARSDNSTNFTYNGVKYCNPVEVDGQCFQYYPICHFCNEKIVLESFSNHCCAYAELIKLIKKKMQNIKGFGMFASLSQATLREIAEELERRRLENLVNVIHSYLRGTSQNTLLPHGRIAKLPLAIAARHQGKEEVLGKEICEIPSDVPIGVNDGQLWNRIQHFMKANCQSQNVNKIEDLKTYHEIYQLYKKQKGIHKKENLRKEYINESKHDAYEKSVANDVFPHESLNSKNVKDNDEHTVRAKEDGVTCPNTSQDRKDAILDKHSYIRENDSKIISRRRYLRKVENLVGGAFLEEIINGWTTKRKVNNEIKDQTSLDRSPSSENKLANRTNNLVNLDDARKSEEISKQHSFSNPLKNFGKLEKYGINNDNYTIELQNGKFSLTENNSKQKIGKGIKSDPAHEEEDLYKIIKKKEKVDGPFMKRKATANDAKDTAGKKTERNKINFEDTQTKMSNKSTEITQKKSKSLGSEKNSKLTTESKSAPTVSSGKQNKKGATDGYNNYKRKTPKTIQKGLTLVLVHISSSSMRASSEETGINVFGFIPYRLSDPKYIECGWSRIPKKYHMKKVSIFSVTQGKKNICWCKGEQEVFTYPDGSVFSILREGGTGEIFYQDGLPAVFVTKENNRIVTTVFSEGKANLLSLRVVGRFDSYGHGIIYDDRGKVRMQYTQTWGRVIDPVTGRFMRWYWKIDLKDSFNKMPLKAQRLHAESKKENLFCLGEEPKPLSKNIRSPIPFFTMKLNDAISFRLFEQHDMCLLFYGNKTCFRLELGVAVESSKEEFYEWRIDRDKEKGFVIAKDMGSIHDELLPPHPKLPRDLPRAPVALQPNEGRREKTLFIHRAIKADSEDRKSLN